MYIMNTYGPLYGVSAIAANRFLSFLFGVAFPLFTIQSELSVTKIPLFRLYYSSLSPYSEVSSATFGLSFLGLRHFIQLPSTSLRNTTDRNDDSV